MANMPDPYHCTFSLRLPEELLAKLQSLAADSDMTAVQIITSILHEELDQQPLSDEDLNWIRQEVERNENRRASH